MSYLGKVLLVDDDQNVLELVKLYGEREGFKVIGVSNGDLVLAAFDRENPDVVILDIMLPGQDGLTTTTWLRIRAGFLAERSCWRLSGDMISSVISVR